jgi:ABC-type branched-subunit amino acid transport system ATPase component
MGVVPIKTGSIALDGQDISRDVPYERVRKGVGYVPQGREIFGRLTNPPRASSPASSRTSAASSACWPTAA